MGVWTSALVAKEPFPNIWVRPVRKFLSPVESKFSAIYIYYTNVALDGNEMVRVLPSKVSSKLSGDSFF